MFGKDKPQTQSTRTRAEIEEDYRALTYADLLDQQADWEEEPAIAEDLRRDAREVRRNHPTP